MQFRVLVPSGTNFGEPRRGIDEIVEYAWIQANIAKRLRVIVEMNGEHVGGARGLSESDLARAYKTQVDPRLNYEQAMEVALRIGGQLNDSH